MIDKSLVADCRTDIVALRQRPDAFSPVGPYSYSYYCFWLSLSTFPGYARQYRALASFLSSQLGSKVKVIGVEDRGVTGNFEVTVVGTGHQLLHSKRKYGQGKAESASERAVIVDQIRELLDDQE